MENVLLNFAYVLYILAALFRSNLALRVTLAAASVAFVIYGIVADNASVVVWNVVFGCISVFHIYKLWQARRPIELSAEEFDAYERVFPDLTQNDFVYLWEMGEQMVYDDDTLMRQGNEVQSLLLLLKGDITIEIDGSEITRGKLYDFIGEMSLASGQPASATVHCEGRVVVRRWSQDQLRGLTRTRPDVASQLWQILGQDLTGKVNRR